MQKKGRARSDSSANATAEVYQRIMKKLQHEQSAPQESEAAAGQEKKLRNVMKEMDEENEEASFGTQPTPPTLRIVVEEVRQMVSQKLELADVSSLKEAMRLVFESRTMLDKLLKDIPSYSTYRDKDGLDGPEVTRELQDMYQEFRKIPIVLPTATYTSKPETGKVVPSFTGRIADGNEEGPRRPLAPQRRPTNASSDHRRSGMGQTVQSFTRQSLKTAPIYPANITSQKDYALLMKHLRRQTQVMDSSTQTDESQMDLIHPDDYNKALRRITQLEILLGEYELITTRLNAQLDTARGAMSSRGKVVGYLRQTLYKECCVLRQQLTHFSQRQSNALSSAFSGTFSATSTSTTASGFLEEGGLRDLTSVHSLLDLVLLAVEKDKVLTDKGEQDSAEEQLRRLQRHLADRQARWKKELVALRARFGLVMGEKNKQLQAVKLSNDVQRLRSATSTVAVNIRDDFAVLKHAVNSQLAGLRKFMHDAIEEVMFTVRKTSKELHALRHIRVERNALCEAIEALHQLLLPMMNNVYALYGTHLWPTYKLPEPVRGHLQATFSHDVLDAIDHPLTQLHVLFSSVKKYLRSSLTPFEQLPLQGRPQYGRPFRKLCFKILSSDGCSTIEQVQSIRECLVEEERLRKLMLRCNFAVKAYSLTADAIESRSREAMLEIGYDPELNVLPVQAKVEHLRSLLRLELDKKHKLELDRMQNAKFVYAFWNENAVALALPFSPRPTTAHADTHPVVPPKQPGLAAGTASEKAPLKAEPS